MNTKPKVQQTITIALTFLTEQYKYIKENDLFQNIIGIFIGSLFVFGIASINFIFSILTFGLTLYSIREIIRYKTSEHKDETSTYTTLTFWVALTSMNQFYNMLYVIFNAFGGYIMLMLLNFSYMYMFTNLINNFKQWYIETIGNLTTLDMKKATEQTKDTQLLTTENINNNINFLTKLYSANSVIFDDVILGYGSKLTAGTFGIIKSGSMLTSELFKSGYQKLYGMSKNINQNNTVQVPDIIISEETADKDYTGQLGEEITELDEDVPQ